MARRRHPAMARLGDAVLVAADPVEVVEGPAVWDVLARCGLSGGAAPDGWWIGLLGYDLAGDVERLPAPRPDPGGPPPAWLARYDRVAAFTADGVEVRGAGAPAGAWRAAPDPVRTPGPGTWTTSLPPAAYRARVARIRELIRAGDCYQVNLAQRIEAGWDGGAPALARRLWDAAGPAAHRAYLAPGAGVLVSASPERLAWAEGGVAVSQPIKGTAPPGRAAALAASAKDRAEHVMIVDLVRNDLGRVARPGGVDVPVLMAPLRTAYAEHLVSTVRAALAPGTDAAALVRAVFPGGSVTGCPKVRAMEVIHDLEPVSRGPAFGSVVAIGPDGTLDASILIRTAWLRDGVARYWSGGAVTWDSDPDAEHREAMAKARPFLAAIGT